MSRHRSAFGWWLGGLALWAFASGSTATAGAGQTRYVRVGSVFTNGVYSSWATAAGTIQLAVDAAAAGDTVIVSNGVYNVGGRAVFGTMTNRVAIDKAVTVQSVNGPTVTFIVGQGPVGPGAVRCAYAANGAVLAGFTLTNGATLGSSGDPVMEQCGGGVWCETADATITNCTLAGNAAANAGGGSYGGTLDHCMVLRNASQNGGGVYGCTAKSCALAGNTASNRGGGASDATLAQCTLFGNSAAVGGGMSGCVLDNGIAYGNSAPGGANWDSSCSANSTCSTPLAPGVGNIDADPLLTDNSHVGAGSPCIAAGDAAYVTGSDLDGNAWKDPPSMGCNEWVDGTATGKLAVSIVAAYTTVAAGFAVDFTAFIDGHAAGNGWSFGDGAAASNQLAVSHLWTATGSYDVVLSAYNDTFVGGVTSTVRVEVVAQPVGYVVKGNASAARPFTNWVTAAGTIQDAIDAASVPGSLVLVSNGVYDAGGVALGGKALVNRAALTTPIEVRSVNGPTVTLIQGSSMGDAAVRCAYVTGRAVLSGFTLTNGFTRVPATDDGDKSGGGVWIESGGLVTNCVLTGCGSENYGGGAYGGLLVDCTLSGNTSGNGGGAYQATLDQCTLTGNSANTGGGVQECVVKRCTLSANAATNGGGGAYRGSLYNCVLAGNSALYGAGACGSASTAPQYCLLVNCTVCGNTAITTGGGVSLSILTNCIVYANTAVTSENGDSSLFDYSCTLPMPAIGTGNITNDPVFVDTGTNDFHLQVSSPCIDAGTWQDWMPGATDLAGNPRIARRSVDMGAYEFSLVTAPVVDNEPVFNVSWTSAMLVGDLMSDGGTATIVRIYWGTNDGAQAEAAWATFNGMGFEPPGRFSTYATGLASGTTYWYRCWASNSAGVAWAPASVMFGTPLPDTPSNTHYVAVGNPSPVAPYTTWLTAATTIQDAVDAATDGDTVLVNDGVYDTGGRAVFGAMVNRVAVEKAITVRSANGPGTTFIVGAGVGTGGNNNGDGAVRCVYLTNGTTLAGFALTNGHTRTSGDLDLEQSGGGVWCESGATVSNCTLAGNSANNLGGGVRGGEIYYCTISGNSASCGGGTEGGTINNCLIIGNSAWNIGGGAQGGTINNCTISGNSAYSTGGAHHGTVNNCIVYFNSSGNLNACALTNSCTAYDTGGTGNITNDPQFVDAASGNFHLKPTSPCIDTGTNQPWMATAKDLDGHPRIAGGIVDMGAYEYTVALPPVVDDASGASAIGTNTATLNGNLVSDGGTTTTVRIYWGQTDGGPVEIGWANEIELGEMTVGSTSSDLTGLAPGTTYYYRSWASNAAGVVWAPVSSTFTTLVAEAASNTHYVALASTTPVYPYTNWVTAATSIQAALDAATAGDTVLVSNGIYSVGVNVVVTQGIQVVGVGGPGLTVIDGGNTSPCLRVSNPGAVVQGFTLTRGWAQFVQGGGLSLSNGLVDRCVISGNRAGDTGGGVALYAGTLRNCLVVSNESDYCAGVFAPGGVVLNCTIATNVSHDSGIGGIGNFNGNVAVHNSIVAGNASGTLQTNWGGNVTFSFSCTIPLSTNGVGNVAATPLFVDPAGDFHLKAASPCRDAGTNESWMGAASDLDGNPRIAMGTVDIGAYETAAAADPANNTHYVSIASPSPTPPYTTWATAATNLQDAVDAATAGDTVLVSNGVYAAGGRTLGSGLTNRVAVNKAIVLRSVNGPDVTSIAGHNPPGDAAVRCVYLGNNAILDGFTLTNGATFGYGDVTNEMSGGGLWAASSALATNCTITANQASSRGGGAFGGTLRNCRVSGNLLSNFGGWVFGGGAYGAALYGCSLTGNAIMGYDGANGGGAASCTLFECVLAGNIASAQMGAGSGGGAWSSALEGCLVVGNVATNFSHNSMGGGTYSSTLRSSTVSENTADNGGGLCLGTATNCIVYGNVATVSNNVWMGTVGFSCTTPDPGGPGNRATNPQFVDATNGNFRLQAISPCINAGTNEAWMIGASDLDGNPRLMGGRVDMGAYESFTGVTWTITATIGTNGSITPPGAIVTNGANPSFAITPDSGCHILDVLVDGGSIGGAVSGNWVSASVTFSNVTMNHTVAATFAGNIDAVIPSSGPFVGGNTVTIRGPALGFGANEITNVTLAGIPAAIVSQNVTQVVVTAGAAGAPVTGDVIVYRSGGHGIANLVNGYTYALLPAPQRLAATDGGYTNRVALVWDPVPGVTGYGVWRGTSTNLAAAVLVAGGLAPTTNRYDDVTAVPLQRYYYWVAGQIGTNRQTVSASDAGFAALGTSALFYSGAGTNGIYTLYRCREDGSGEMRLFNDAVTRLYPAVSPDATEIAYIRWTGSTSEVCIASINGAGEHSIAQCTTAFGLSCVNWAPDGTSLVYVAHSDNSTRDGYLYRINKDGTGQALVVPNTDFDKHFASYSPDGLTICYARNETGWYAWPQNLFVINADGSNERRLTSHGNGEDFKVFTCRFSPDGRTIVYQMGYSNPGNSTLWTVSPAGSNDTMIVDNAYSDERPAFTRDGSKLVFNRNIGGHWQLATANPDGLNVQVLPMGPVPTDRMAPVQAIVNAAFAADGTIQCTILPPAVGTSAQWRVTSGADTNWHASGEVTAPLAPTGSPYTVTFLAVAGWVTPADITGLAPVPGAISAVTAIYVPNNMALIPAQTYRMGIYQGAGGVSVTLNAFFIDRRPVTVAQFQDFCTATGNAMPTNAPAWSAGWTTNTSLPMVMVTWDEAAAYATWAGKRLATEAEYECAMRDSLTNSAYPWGDSIAATQANYNANVGLPTAAGTYPPTLHYGLYDIAGNVWEWCGDWYVSTLTGPVTNPVGPAAGLTKSLRGGSWVNPASRLRCATRYQMDPFARYADLGFRCAASPAALTAPFVGGAAGGVPEWWKQYYFGVAANGFDANRDTDGDGLTDGQEYAAGTDPTRADSCLKILTIRPSGAGVGVTWEGGATATQYLEVLRDVAGTGATWSALFTNLPPTATVTNFTDTGSGGAVRLYRIRATR